MVIAQMMIPRACSNWNFFLDPVTTSYQPARLRICQTHELETVVNVAETLIQPSLVAKWWWKCNLGTQYIKCNVILPIQKLGSETCGGGIACLNVRVPAPAPPLLDFGQGSVDLLRG